MKRSEEGFTLVELLVVIALVALLGVGASVATILMMRVTEQSNEHNTAVCQVQNAGYWISNDALMSGNVVVDDDPQTTDFLIFTWTEWGYDQDSTYHKVTYSFQNLSDGIGKLKREYWSSAGASQQTLVAEYIYYNPDDPDNTTKVSYQTPVLTMQLVATLGEATETREYTIWCRPEF